MAISILLIGGSSNTGKSTTAEYIAQELIKNGYNTIKSQSTGNISVDKLYQLRGNDNSGRQVDIVINTAADNIPTINNFDSFLKQVPCDIIITAIRSFGKERADIQKVIQKYRVKNGFEIEIPLAKINQKASNKNVAMKWYSNCVETLAKNILSVAPFNLRI